MHNTVLSISGSVPHGLYYYLAMKSKVQKERKRVSEPETCATVHGAKQAATLAFLKTLLETNRHSASTDVKTDVFC